MLTFRIPPTCGCFLRMLVPWVAIQSGLSARATAADWPTYLHDVARTGTTSETLAWPLAESWRFESRHAPEPAWPPPAEQDFWNRKTGLPARVVFDRAFHVVSDGHLVYFGSSADDQVRAIDLHSGSVRWTFYCGGPVRLAPTVDQGRLFFGSDDGYVYCLDSRSGTPRWKYRRAEAVRQVPGNGRMISVWPVRSGVVVLDGQVRFASGLFPLQGTYQHVLDADTGKWLAEGPLRFSPQGYLRLEGKRLVAPQGRAKPVTLAGLDRAASPSASVPSEKGEDLSVIRAASTRVAGGDGQLVATTEDGEVVWSGEADGKVYSLAVAGGCLLASTDRGIIHCFRPAGDLSRDSKLTRAPERADLAGLADELSNDAMSRWARRQLSEAGVDRGFALVLGENVASISAEMARPAGFKIVGGMTDRSRLARARRRLSQQGLYGRIALEHLEQQRELPYGSRLFNLIVVCLGESISAPQVPAKEIARLLVPGRGVAVIGPVRSEGGFSALRDWAKSISDKTTCEEFHGLGGIHIRRPVLEGAGEWTHMYAAPDNTACSNDRLVGSQLKLQWFGRPGPRQMLDRHHRTVPPLYSAGRLYVPGNDRVFAVDAYNGSPLWDVAITNFRRVGVMRDAGSMAAAKDYLYVVAGDRCYGLNSRNGSFDLNFSVPGGSPREWGYVAYVGHQLFGSTVRQGASRDRHSREQIMETYFDSVPIVTSDSVFCVDRHTGKRHWQYPAKGGAILNPTITIGAGRMYFVESTNPGTVANGDGRSDLKALVGSGAVLVALRLEDGQVEWRRQVDFSAIEHHLYLCSAGDKLIAVGSKNKQVGGHATVWYDLFAFNAVDGEFAWFATQNQRQGVNGDHGEQDHHPVVVDGVVYQEPYAYQLESGERLDEWQLKREGHGCGTVSASANAFFFRAGSPTICDLATGSKSKVTSVSRPGCWINMIPAGGLLLIPEASSGCTCDFPMQTSIALAADPLPQGQ